MTIRAGGGGYILQCDICGDESGYIFTDFRDAVGYKKVGGWDSQCIDGEWEDICPYCQE